jgi:MFS family permease
MAAGRSPALFRGLQSRAFAALWAGQTISRLGDSVSTIAVAWLVLQLTGSAAAMGLVLAAHVVAFLAFSLAGGVLVDRLGRLPIMLASDGSRLVLTGGLAALIATGNVGLPTVVLFAAVFGAVEAFFYPAYMAAVPDLVPSDDRPSANSLQHLSRRLASLVGPAIGAGLVAGGGMAAAFALDAASFGVSAILIVVAIRFAGPGRSRGRAALAGLAPALAVAPAAGLAPALALVDPSAQLDPDPQPGPAPDRAIGAGRPSALADLRDGIRTVTEAPWLWIAIVLASVTGITLAGPIGAGLPLLVERHLHAGVEVLGLVQATIAAGAIVAAVVLGSRPRLRHRGLLLYGTWITLALGIAAVGLPIGIPGVVVAAALVGASGATVGLTWTNTLQDLVPPERLGRVVSIDAMGSSALEPIGFVLAGVAADALGPATVFLGGGLLSAAIIALALTQRSIRELD